jgi:hypothetical protein
LPETIFLFNIRHLLCTGWYAGIKFHNKRIWKPWFYKCRKGAKPQGLFHFYIANKP